MRVLILPSFYPTTDEPNRGVFFKQQANLCVRNDVELHVLYYELRSLKKIKWIKNWKNHFQNRVYKEDKLTVFRCHAWNIIPTQYKLGNKIWIYATLKLYEAYIKKFGHPDVIHVQSAFQAGYVALAINKKYNIPYFINEHSTSVKLAKFSTVEIDEYKTIFESAYCSVAVSRPFANAISTKFSVKENQIRIIPNFIDSDFFSPGLMQLKAAKNMVFLVVCFLEKKKRVDRLIDAFYKAFKNDKTVKLIIGGDGPERNLIDHKIAEYGLKGQVSMLGALSQTEVRDQMRACDCFILPSDVETFGVVLIEAMAIGKPVIATRSGGPEDFIFDEVGILAETDSSSIKKALLTMYKQIDNFKSDAIRNYVLQNFSGQSVSIKVINLYNEIIKAH